MRRPSILDVTLALASRGGFDAVQMREVAERADVALGTLYRYFPSKIHLLVSAMCARVPQAAEKLERTPVPGDTAVDRVLYVLGRHTRTLQRTPMLTEAMTRAIMSADASVANEVLEVDRHTRRMIIGAMTDGRAHGRAPADRRGHRRGVAVQPDVLGDAPVARPRTSPSAWSSPSGCCSAPTRVADPPLPRSPDRPAGRSSAVSRRHAGPLPVTRTRTSFGVRRGMRSGHVTRGNALDGRVAVVTGAGAGLGRAEALALAEGGAAVVVNDVGPAAQTVVDEIRAAGGSAVAVLGDVGDWALGEHLVQTAVSEFGSLDVLVNNAGVLRDKMIFSLSESDWDDVIRVHLKGHASVSRAAAVHWRAASKAAEGPVYGRVVNTSSEAFLFGSAGQPNYSAAKAGIVALTLSTAQGLARYGVKVNAICPRARTQMTAHVFGEAEATGELDRLAPERVGTFVRYLASPAAEAISGQVFVVYGDLVGLMAAPVVEQKFQASGSAFTVEELDEQLTPYFADRDPGRTYSGPVRGAARLRPGAGRRGLSHR